MTDSSHASAVGTVDNLYGYGAFSLPTSAPSSPSSDSRITVTDLTGFYMDNPDTGAGTVTNARGLAIETINRGTNNTQVLLGTLTSPSGDWVIHSADTFQSALAGPTKIGAATSPTASTVLDLESTVGALLLPRMTTTQRDALTATNGMIIYNTTNGVVEAREGGAWVNI